MTSLAGLAPALAFVLLVAAVRPRFADWRTALLGAAVLWGLSVVAVTEALSLARAVHVGPLLGAWLALCALLAWVVARRGRIRVRAPSRVSLRTVAGIAGRVTLRRPAAMVLVAVGAIAAAVGVVALAAPPNTYDSMTYHMSRVAHWAQNRSIEHYATPIVRQLFQPPWAEWAILQSYVLTGGDRLANLVQWLSMLGALTGVSLVAKQLGGDRRAQILAAAVAVTIPAGVVQASGTKNDYVAAFWLTCLAVFVLALNGQPRGASLGRWIALAGGALGLALLTKASAYLFAAPLVVWTCLARYRRDGVGAWRVVAGLVIVAAATNAGHLARNVERSGWPLGPVRDGPYEYVNGSFGPRTTLSVAARNAGLHLGTPWGALNALTDGAIRAGHRYLGLPVDDPASTWWGSRFQVAGPKRHEDAISNGLHLALIAGAFLALAVRAELRTPDRVAYAAALVIAFLLFCTLLRWQPWNGRLHLPLFVLWAPLIGIALARWARAGTVVVVALVAVALLMVLANEPRPLVAALREPREAQYFRNQPALHGPYARAVRLLAERGCARIGLSLGSDDWEYPLWVLARTALPEARLEHVVDEPGPDQRPMSTGTGDPAPCAIIATRAPDRTEWLHHGVRYERVLADPPLALYVRDAARPVK